MTTVCLPARGRGDARADVQPLASPSAAIVQKGWVRPHHPDRGGVGGALRRTDSAVRITGLTGARVFTAPSTWSQQQRHGGARTVLSAFSH